MNLTLAKNQERYSKLEKIVDTMLEQCADKEMTYEEYEEIICILKRKAERRFILQHQVKDNTKE